MKIQPSQDSDETVMDKESYLEPKWSEILSAIYLGKLNRKLQKRYYASLLCVQIHPTSKEEIGALCRKNRH